MLVHKLIYQLDGTVRGDTERTRAGGGQGQVTREDGGGEILDEVVMKAK